MEWIKSVIKKVAEFLKQKKIRQLVIFLLIIFFYLAGLLAQLFNNRYQWSPGKELYLPSLNPIKGLAMLFTPFGVQAIAGLFLFSAMAALFIYMNREDRTGMTYDKVRKFWYSDKGVYGTAGWMSDKELKAYFDVRPESEAGEPNEIIFGCKDGKVVSRKADSMLGPHIAVMGSSGSMKSRTISRALIISCAKKGKSLVVTDPKGELAADTTKYLESYDFEVKILNFLDPTNSHRYDGLDGARDYPLFVSNVVEAIISNTGGGMGDPIYDAAEGDLLTALIFLQLERKDVDYPTLKGAYQVLLDTADAEEMDAYFAACKKPSRALSAYNLFRKASPNMQGNICLGLGVRLAVMQNEEIADLMCGTDMDLQIIGQKKMAYFLILSDQDNTMRFVSATFFSLLFLRLVQYADAYGPNGRLPVPVILLLDEFCSIVGSINGFPQKLSNIRSRGLEVCIVFQQLGQLMNRFPDNLWSEILGNTDTIICLGCSSDPVTAKFISDRSGEVTIYADTIMKSRNAFMPSMLQPNYRHSEGAGRRKLLTPDEVMRMDRRKMLVMVTGQQILELEKFDYTRNPESDKFVPTSVRGLEIVPQPLPVSVEDALEVLGQNRKLKEESPSTKKDSIAEEEKSKSTISMPKKRQPKSSRNKPGKGVVHDGVDDIQIRIDDYMRIQQKNPAADSHSSSDGVCETEKPKV